MSSRARLFDLSRKTVTGIKRNRKKRKGKLKLKQTRLQKYADELNRNLPNSEVWFQKLFKETDLYNTLYVKFNHPKGKHIFDVYHIDYKYAIEIDGSYHNTNEAIIRDWYKDQFALKQGIKVIRIKAYDLNSYNKGIAEIRKYIKTKVVLP